MNVERVSNQSKVVSFIFFALILILYPLSQIVYQPSWLFNGGMWAEAATNYFPISHSPDWFIKLFATDAGYIPLPQRIISAFGDVLKLPPETIPFYYNWAAIFCSALLVGSFCLPIFRSLISNDIYRFIISLLILSFSEWEIRTYINFTYYAVFFLLIVGSVILTKIEKIPWYFWIAPLLILSKPAVLATVPIFVFIVLRKSSKSIHKVFALLIITAGCIQLLQIYLSRQMGVFDKGASYDLTTQVLDSLQYLLGIPGVVFTGIQDNIGKEIVIITGLIILCASVATIILKRQKSVLLMASWSVLFFSILLNSVTLNYQWNVENWPPNSIPVVNHSVAPYQAALVIVSFLIFNIAEPFSKNFGKSSLVSATLIFVLFWQASSGWYSKNISNSLEPTWPRVNNGNWVQSSQQINSNTPNTCVSVDPIGWVYGTDCRSLNSPGWSYTSKVHVFPSNRFEIIVPRDLNGTELSGISIAVSPVSGRSQPVDLTLYITLSDKTVHVYSGSQIIESSGGTVQMSGEDSVRISSIKDIFVVSNDDIYIIGNYEQEIFVPATIWLGH